MTRTRYQPSGYVSVHHDDVRQLGTDHCGQRLKIVYGKPKPANFEQAVSVVAIGS